MEFNKYQEFTETKAVYNTKVYAEMEDGSKVNMSWAYPAYALAEEAGEVAGKFAKFIRKSGTDLSELRQAVMPELGDTLFQISETARQLGITLEDVAKYNMDKLNSREERGVLVGEGDHR